jgi:RHS repeat-associated protein
MIRFRMRFSVLLLMASAWLPEIADAHFVGEVNWAGFDPPSVSEMAHPAADPPDPLRRNLRLSVGAAVPRCMVAVGGDAATPAAPRATYDYDDRVHREASLSGTRPVRFALFTYDDGSFLSRDNRCGQRLVGVDCRESCWFWDGLAWGGVLFQGLWHDPVTGLAYARNRWYDPRTAHWLSPDPMGPVDSPNLYAFVGWRPHMARDPNGELAFLPVLGYMAVSAAVSVAIGASFETAQTIYAEDEWDYGWSDVGIDAGLGALTFGLNKFAHLRHLRHLGKGRTALRIGGEAGLDIGAEALRCRIQGRDCSFGQLALGAAFNFGIGEGGALAGRYARSFMRSSSIDSMAGNSWNSFRSAYGGTGFTLNGTFSMSSMYGRRNSLSFPMFEGTARLRHSASRIGRTLRRHLSIEGHHYISKKNWTSNPILQHAESIGVSRDASWNVKRTWGHRGGHVGSYYDRVDNLVQEAFLGVDYATIKDPAVMQAILEDVVGQLRGQVRWGRAPGLAQVLGREHIRMYR